MNNWNNNDSQFFMDTSVAERTCYLCLASKLIWPLWLLNIFTQWGWFVPFCPDDFPGQIKGSESPPNFLFLSIFRAGRTSLCPLSSSSRITTPWGEPSSLWTFESILLDQRLPVEHKLDVFIPPLTRTLLCRLWHSTTSVLFNLLGDLHSSLLQRRTM